MDWDGYMGVPLDSFPDIFPSDCLKDSEVLSNALADADSAANKHFSRECHGFLLEFLRNLEAECL